MGQVSEPGKVVQVMKDWVLLLPGLDIVSDCFEYMAEVNVGMLDHL